MTAETPLTRVMEIGGGQIGTRRGDFGGVRLTTWFDGERVASRRELAR